jgi:hypothetical protein
MADPEPKAADRGFDYRPFLLGRAFSGIPKAIGAAKRLSLVSILTIFA